jgi:phosphate-selective porin OprO/OprP
MRTHSTLPAEADAGPDDTLPLPPALLRELRQALLAIRFYTGPLGLHGEYIQSYQTVSRATFATVKLKHTAWQVTGSWFLTGEKNSFRSATPKQPFDPKAGSFGALELAARYSELSIDDATFPTYASATGTPRKAKAWAVGLNWYLARAIKLAADYEHTTFTGGAATGDREAENFVVTRVQYAF